MDILYAVCTKQENAPDLLVKMYLSNRFSYEERLEYVRCWAAIEGKGSLPKPSSSFKRSPTLATGPPLQQWLVWAQTDTGWACAAAHAHAAKKTVARFTFAPVQLYPYRQSLARFLRSYASVATLEKSGQRYLDAVVRFACPGYRTALSSTSTFLHASALIPDTINSVMSPCVHRTVSRQYTDVKWSACTLQQFMLAVSILADAIGSAAVYVNGDVCTYTKGPAIFIAHDYDINMGDMVGFIQDDTIYYADGSYLDVIGAFVQHSPECGLHAAFARTAPPPGRLASHIT